MACSRFTHGPGMFMLTRFAVLATCLALASVLSGGCTLLPVSRAPAGILDRQWGQLRRRLRRALLQLVRPKLEFDPCAGPAFRVDRSSALAEARGRHLGPRGGFATRARRPGESNRNVPPARTSPRTEACASRARYFSSA